MSVIKVGVQIRRAIAALTTTTRIVRFATIELVRGASAAAATASVSLGIRSGRGTIQRIDHLHGNYASFLIGFSTEAFTLLELSSGHHDVLEDLKLFGMFFEQIVIHA